MWRFCWRTSSATCCLAKSPAGTSTRGPPLWLVLACSSSGANARSVSNERKRFTRDDASIVVQKSGSKRLESNDCLGIQNTRDWLNLLGNKMPDVGALLDIELHQQIEIARSRINLGRDLGIGERIGYRIGFAEVTFDLHEKWDHAFLLGSAAARNAAKTRRVDKSAERPLGTTPARPGGPHRSIWRTDQELIQGCRFQKASSQGD